MKKKISRRKIKLVYRIFIRLYCHLFSCCWTTLLHIYNLPTRLLQHRFAQLKFESPLQALQLGNAVRIYLSIIGSTWKVFYYFMLLLLFKSANGEISLLNKHTSRGTANVNKHNESPYFCIISVMKLLYYNAIVWQWCEGACPSHRCTPCTFITVAHNRWSRIGSRVCSQRCIFNRKTYVGGAETSVWQAVWEPGLPTLQPSLWVARSAIGRASRPISGRRDLRKTPPCTRAACTQKSQEKRGCWASAVTLHCAEMWSSGRSCRWGEIELTHLFNALAGFAVMELLAWAQRSSSHMSVHGASPHLPAASICALQQGSISCYCQLASGGCCLVDALVCVFWYCPSA